MFPQTESQYDFLPWVNFEAGNKYVDYVLLSPVNNTLNLVRQPVNAAFNLFGYGEEKAIEGLQAAGMSRDEAEFAIRILPLFKAASAPQELTAFSQSMRTVPRVLSAQADDWWKAYVRSIESFNKKVGMNETGAFSLKGFDDLSDARAKFIHDQFVKRVRPRATERTFETPWSSSSGLGTRRFDDFDPTTGTGFEGNTTPWSQMSQEQLTRKLHQAGSDYVLLKTDPNVKRVIWFGTEEFPTTGLGAQLAEALREAGIPYWVVKP